MINRKLMLAAWASAFLLISPLYGSAQDIVDESQISLETLKSVFAEAYMTGEINSDALIIKESGLINIRAVYIKSS